MVQGSRVTVHSRHGPVEGVFGRKAIHLQSPQERQQVPRLKEMWIDIGARDKADAERLVQLGDYATYRLGVTELQNGFISSPGLDDKAGLFVVAEAFRRCSEVGLKVGLYAVSTVQEEVGMRGADTAAFALRPEIAVAIDLTNATDEPGTNRGMVPCLLGHGPVIPSGPGTNPVIGRMLVDCAVPRRIPRQVAPDGQLSAFGGGEMVAYVHDDIDASSGVATGPTSGGWTPTLPHLRRR